MIDPVVRNAELRALVELARTQPRPDVHVEIGDIRRGVERAAAKRRWALGAGLALAAALVLAAVAVPSALRRSEAEAASQAPATTRIEGAQGEADLHPTRGAASRAPVEGDAPLAVEPEPEPELEIDEPAPPTERRTDSAAVRGSESAAELSQRAEAEIGEGRPSAAIKTLTKIVRVHPRSAEARSALMDLGRLHRAAGSNDRARCAYTLYLQRWPMSSLDADVRRALNALGPGPACSGLTPRD